MPNIQSASGTDAATDRPDDVVLHAQGLEKTYDPYLPWEPSVEVLTGADLELHAGEVVGIVGENGSGKSTLMQCLVGALDPDAGEVARPGGVGWCPQDDRLYDRLTVDETFRLFGEAHGMSEAEIADAADRLTERLDFERFRDRRVDRLSGGNRRKLTLSVSLMHDPDVLLLDEPYTGFDWETYLAFWDLADDLSERGTAVAVISHLVSEHERFDRIYELADGKLAEVDEPGGEAAAADDGREADGADQQAATGGEHA